MDDPITIHDARAQHEALEVAAKGSPVRQYRYLLRAQQREWASAIDFFEGAEGEGVIELAGTLVPGMFLAYWSDENTLTFRRILRRTRGSDLSFELDSDGMRPVYRSYASVMSPAVVQR